MKSEQRIYREAAVQPLNWRQIRTLTAASIKSRYRNTFAGLLWVVLSPLMMYSAQGYVFKYILHIDYDNYPLFLLTGLLPWIFLTQSTTMSASLFLTNSRLFKSFPIHPFASLFSILLDNLINFTLVFTVIFLGLMAFGSHPQILHFLLMPIPFFFLFIAVFSLAWFLSCLQVFFHDVRFIMDFVFSVMFFLTPIFYPAALIDPELQWVVRVNPIAILLAPIQMLSQDTLPINYWRMVLESALVACGFALVAWQFWRRKKNDIYFRL